MPVISVILPVYNGINFVRESVESVLAQTLTDFDFLILDNHSGDGTWEYLNTITDKRVKLFRNEEYHDLFYNMNYLCKRSETELTKLWSHDDYMVPDALEKIVQFHRANPGLGFSYTAVKAIDENSTVTREAKEDHTPAIVGKEVHARICFRWGSIAGNIANVTIATEVFKKVGYFDESMKICGDYDMWVRIGEYYDIGHINEPLIYLRNHSKQLSRQEEHYIKHVEEDIVVYNKLFTYIPKQLKKEGINEMRKSKLLFYYTLMVHALFRKGFKAAGKFWRALSTIDSPFILTLFFVRIKLLKIK